MCVPGSKFPSLLAAGGALLLTLWLAAPVAVAQPQQPIPRQPVGPGEERVYRLDIPAKRVTSARDIQRLSSTTKRVRGVGLDDDAMAELDSLAGLTELELVDCEPSRDGWRQLGDLYRLERLTIRDCGNIDREVVGFVAGLDSLRVLRLQNLDELTGEMLMPLRDNGAIRKLDLSGCRKLGNDAVEPITRMKTVWSLDLSRTGVRSAGVLALADMANTLKELLLEDVAGISNRALDVVPRLHRLDALSVAGCRQLTDEALQPIEKRSGLLVLSVAGCRRLTDAGMATLAEAPNLQYLDIADCPALTDTGIRHLSSLSRTLMYLDLSGCPKLTDHALLALRNCNHLEWLRLERLNIGGSGLSTIRQLPSLRELSLRGCRSLGDDGVAQIRSDSLEVVDVRDCPHVTSDGRRALRRNLPNLETLRH